MVENQITRRLTGAALAALLLFFACVPVPTNVQALDRVRYQKAYAGPEAVVLGGTPAMLLTLMGMAGVYVACNTDGEWLENSAALASDFAQFVNENGYVNEYNCDISQYVDETGQNIDVSAAYAGGFYTMLQAYLDSESASQLMGEGANSVATHKKSVSIDGHDFPMTDSIPYANRVLSYPSVQELTGQGFALVGYNAKQNGNYLTIDYMFVKSTLAEGIPVQLSYVGNEVYRADFQSGTERKYVLVTMVNNEISGSVSPSNGYWSHWQSNGLGLKMYTGANFSYQGATLVPGAAVSEYAGVFDPASVQARLGEIASGAVDKVRIFEPTAEQLEAGYDYQTIMQNELAGINTGIEGLDQAINTLIGITSAISSWLSSTLFGQYCANVTTWLGDTPFGNIMATVIDGVTDIPGHVDDAGEVVAGGIAALPGAIEGVLERTFPDSVAIPGVLQDVLAGVQAIPATLADVVSAVQTGVMDITAALENVGNIKPNMPEQTDEPMQFALPPAMQADYMNDLRDRVPFCYVVRMQEAMQGLSGNMTYSQAQGLRAQSSSYDMRSFYFDVEIPYAGEVRFDAEPFLSQQFGALDIATTIRILVSVLLCYGILLRAYKVVERAF